MLHMGSRGAMWLRCESLQSRDFHLLASISLKAGIITLASLARLQTEEASFPALQAVVFFEAPKNPLFFCDKRCATIIVH